MLRMQVHACSASLTYLKDFLSSGRKGQPEDQDKERLSDRRKGDPKGFLPCIIPIGSVDNLPNFLPCRSKFGMEINLSCLDKGNLSYCLSSPPKGWPEPKSLGFLSAHEKGNPKFYFPPSLSYAYIDIL